MGYMWWCANEQAHLDTAPYAWNMMERELGLLDSEGKPKATLRTMKQIADRINSLDFTPTSPNEDIVCITSMGQDNWGISYMAYALAKSLNLQLKFSYSKYEIPEADTYMLPSINGTEVMPKKQYFELKKRVYDGATLYISYDYGHLTEFSEFCGISIRDTKILTEQCDVEIDGEILSLERICRKEIYTSAAEVLGYDNLGIPALTKFKYGKGTVYYLNFPLEKNLLSKQNAFSENYSKIYSKIFKDIIDNQPLKTDNPNVKITFYNDKAVLFNFSSETQDVKVNDRYNNFVCMAECEPYDICIMDIKK